MGTNQSKTPKNGWTGDAKFMYTMNEESVQYLDKWKKKYKFKGGLCADDCKKLCEEITKACKGDEKREKKEGLLQAYLWLEQAKKRSECRRRGETFVYGPSKTTR